MAEIFDLIGNQAFPILISIYLLTRFESKMDGLKDAILKLTNMLEKQQGK